MMSLKKEGNIKKSDLLTVGWSEWVSLPELNIPFIKAKIDTGAKTSALHAHNIKQFTRDGVEYVKFSLHPLQNNKAVNLHKKAKIIDERFVMSSNGHKENRLVIATKLMMAGRIWPVEITLSNRDPLRYRLLLGREALSSRVIINPAKKMLLGTVSTQQLKHIYSTGR